MDERQRTQFNKWMLKQLNLNKLKMNETVKTGLTQELKPSYGEFFLRIIKWKLSQLSSAAPTFTNTYLGHSGHAPHQQHLANVSFGHLSILHGLLTGCHGAADQVGHDALELSAGQFHVEMFGTRGVHGQVGEVDVGLKGDKQDWMRTATQANSAE